MKQNIKAGIGSALSFLVLVFVLEWNFVVSLVLSIGIFFAIYFLTKPVVKLGDLYLDQIEQGEELFALLEESKNELNNMEVNALHIEDETVVDKVEVLIGVASDIIRYLETDPDAISKSRHFLDYYFTTADKLIDNYMRLKRANVSQPKFQLIRQRTVESLNLLIQLFSQQRDSYHKDTLLELEVESELLERTIKLSGGELD